MACIPFPSAISLEHVVSWMFASHPSSLILPFCLLWWRYCTLLSCMLSRPQCNLVCVIFSHECMHTGMALACGVAATHCQWVGVQLMARWENVYTVVFSFGKVNVLPTLTSSFGELSIWELFWRIEIWTEKHYFISHIVNHYFHFPPSLTLNELSVPREEILMDLRL